MWRGYTLLLTLALLTSCEKTEDISRQEAIIEGVPSYWKKYFDSKEELLNNSAASIENQGVSFAFITDVHVRANNMKSPMLLKYLISKGLVNKVVCGGDIIYQSYENKEEAISELKAWADSTKGMGVVTLLGNHDLNSNYPLDKTQVLSEQDFFRIICAESSSFVNYAEGELYGYEDNENQKLRYIYLNTGAPDHMTIDNIQIEWLKKRILELEKGWTIVIFCHQFWTWRKSTDATLEYDENGTKIEKAINSIYDKASASIACVISGHCHRNYSKKSDKGFVMTSTTCDTGGFNSEQYDPDTPLRTANTTNEQAFDLFYINTDTRQIKIIRIGAGDTKSDRSFVY